MTPVPGTVAQLRAARNHIDWFTKLARAEGQGAGAAHGLKWAGDNSRYVLFPSLATKAASASLDEFLADCRADAGVGSVGCWSLVPAEPRDLGALLLARGFEWGWRPHWMRLDLKEWNRDLSGIPGISIGLDDLGGPAASGLEPRSMAKVTASRQLSASGEAWHIGARKAGRLIGHVAISVFRTDSSAGIFDCAVAPRQRRRGIGAALTTAACRIARQQGCEDVLLNATDMGEPVYRRVGFESAGYGQTWWLHEQSMSTPPSERETRFVEAVGAGRTGELPPFVESVDLDAMLMCGLTPVEVAARCNQPRAAEWLVAHGATLDLLSCWDLGWRARAAELAANHPAVLAIRRGPAAASPLHTAVDRDDEELVRLILAAGADLTLRDVRFNATPLGWAQHQGRPHLAQLIAAAM